MAPDLLLPGQDAALTTAAHCGTVAASDKVDLVLGASNVAAAG